MTAGPTGIERVRERVPHRAPALLLFEGAVRGPDSAVCRARVSADHPLVRDGAAQSVLALEIIAQACAFSRATGARVTAGNSRLVACRDLELFVPALCPGDELVVTVEREGGDDEAMIFSARVERATGAPVARGRLVVRCVP